MAKLLMNLVLLMTIGHAVSAVDYASDPAVQLFQQYVRINTTTTTSSLAPAKEFWENLVLDLNMTMDTYYFVEDMPVIVIKWPGSNSSLPSVMLNSHMDVVPATDSEWELPPFLANITSDGDIWGRGTQDMKSVSLQYFLALKWLKEQNITLLRDVYMTLMPDEEIGSPSGMIPFLNSSAFEEMNVGVEMDEGAASPLSVYALFYQDKAVWQFQVDCVAASAHSASFPATNETATGKCRNVINKFLDFRDEQYTIAHSTALSYILYAGEYTSVNLNIWNGGTANNIIPESVTLVFDVRLATNLNVTEFEAQLYEWLDESGTNITLTFLEKDEGSAQVVTNSSNPYYVALQEAQTELNITMVPIVAPGATDARFVRLKGIPGFGFSPMANTETLLHTDNERLNAEVYLQGIEFYKVIIQKLANIPAEKTEGLSSSSLVIQGAS